LNDGKICGNPRKIKDLVKRSPPQFQVGVPGSEPLVGVCKRASPHRHDASSKDWPPWSLGGEDRLVDHQRAPQLLVDFAYEAAHGVFAFLNLSAGELEEAS
jgi:hypothetical protein